MSRFKTKRKGSIRKGEFTDSDFIDMKVYEYLRMTHDLMSEYTRIKLMQHSSGSVRSDIVLDEIKNMRNVISDLACWNSEEYCDAIHSNQLTFIDQFIDTFN